MIKVTFPDGATRDYARGTTGTTVVEGISTSLAKKTVAMKWNGVLSDLSDPLDGRRHASSSSCATAPTALGLIRHDAAHVLAEAVQELWPDDAGDHRPGDRERLLLRLQARRRRSREDELRQPSKRRWPRSSQRGAAFTKEVWSRDEAKRVFAAKGEDVQGRADRRHSRPTRRSRSTSRASGSTSAAARTCARPRMSARPSS